MSEGISYIDCAALTTSFDYSPQRRVERHQKAALRRMMKMKSEAKRVEANSATARYSSD